MIDKLICLAFGHKLSWRTGYSNGNKTVDIFRCRRCRKIIREESTRAPGDSQ